MSLLANLKDITALSYYEFNVKGLFTRSSLVINSKGTSKGVWSEDATLILNEPWGITRVISRRCHPGAKRTGQSADKQFRFYVSLRGY